MTGLLLALAAVAVGAVVQGSIGFGYALVAVPALALLYPGAVPVATLVLALPMTLLMTAHEWRSIDGRGFFVITGGRVFGTAAGAALIAAAPVRLLSGLVGLLIVAAALMSLLRPDFEIRNGTRLAGGVASGIMSTVASLGGPPLALIYQDRSGPELRSTLAVSFFVGIVMSLAALALAGKVEGAQLVLALQLLPGLLLGLWASRFVVKRVDERWVRPAVLTFAAVAGLAVALLALRG